MQSTIGAADSRRPDHAVPGYSADERERLFEEPFDRPAVAACYLLGTLDGRVVFDLVAREARQLHRALLAPLPQPILGHLLGHLLVRDDGPEGGPGSRNDAPDVVAAPADGDPASLAELVGELVDPLWDVLVDASRHREVRQRVERVGVAAVLGEDEIRLEGP